MRASSPAVPAVTGFWSRWFGLVALVASIVLLGCNWPVMKIALQSTSPLWMASARLLLAGALGFAVLAAQGTLVWPARREWPIILVLGVFQGALMTGLITYGVSTVGAGRSAILAYTTPIWVIPGAALLFGERVARWQLVGLGLGVAGVLVMFNPIDFDWTDLRVLLGNASVLAGAIAWSVAMLASRGHVWRLAPLQTMPYMTLLGGLLLLPPAMLLEGPMLRAAPTVGFVAAMAYASAAATFVAYWMTVEAARRLPAARMSMGQLATPVLGVASSALWLGDRPTAGAIAGLALILAGVAISASASRPAG